MPNLRVLEGHDESAPRPRRLRAALSKLSSCAHFDAFTLDALAEAGRPPGEDGLYGDMETRDFARTRHWSLCCAGTLACPRA